MALTFPGGIAFYDRRSTACKEFSEMEAPAFCRYDIPDGFDTIVNAGDMIFVNSPLMRDHEGFYIYSTVSGNVCEVNRKIVTVENDGEFVSVPLFEQIQKPVLELTSDEIISYVKSCGITGAFSGEPVYRKMERSLQKARRLVISCVESDPCSGHVRSFAVKNADGIVLGAKLVMLALGIKKTVIAFGERDTKVASAFEKVITHKNMLVSAFVDEKYPQGDDRLLISSIYHVEIPFSRTPEECGYLVMSAETVFNVYHCLKNACCVTKKALTVAGDGIPSPLNLMAHVGTPFEDIASSYQAETDAFAVNGGIINGRITDGGAVSQSTNVLAFVRPYKQHTDECIRCSRCASVCPMHLIPYMFLENHQNGRHGDNIDFGIYNCIECGCCAYVCPSAIDLLGMIRNYRGEASIVYESDEPDDLPDIPNEAVFFEENSDPFFGATPESAVDVNSEEQSDDDVEALPEADESIAAAVREAESTPSDGDSDLVSIPELDLSEIGKKRKKKKKDFRKELGDVLKANPEDFDEKGDDANDDCK